MRISIMELEFEHGGPHWLHPSWRFLDQVDATRAKDTEHNPDAREPATFGDGGTKT